MIRVQRGAGAMRRAGISLIELLVVTVIVLMVSAVTIRQLAPALTSRNIREGARMVSAFLNAARSRAIQSGRPMGVWIERQPGLPEASVSLYYAGTPELYSGDFTGSLAKAFTLPDWITTGQSNSSQDFAYCVWPTDGSAWSSTTSSFVQPGDQIRIGYNSPWYPLQTVNTLTSITLSSATSAMAANYWILGVYPAPVTTTAMTQLAPYPYSVRYPTNLPSDPSQLTQGSTGTTSGTALPYQIMRQPQRLAGGGIQLPESVVIDLNFSGVERYNTLPNVPFWPRTDTTSNYYTGKAVNDTSLHNDPLLATRPVIINFNSTGAVDLLYTIRWVTSSTFSWSGQPVVDPIFLLIGKSERVPLGATSNTIANATLTTSDFVSAQSHFNYADLDNLYVVVHPISGFVGTAPVTAVTGVTNATITSTGTASISTAVTSSRNRANTFSVSTGGK